VLGLGLHSDGGLRWGVEPIRTVLSEHGCPIAPSTYYDARTSADRRTQRELRDEELEAEIRRVHAENYGVYGACKVWLGETVACPAGPAARRGRQGWYPVHPAGAARRGRGDRRVRPGHVQPAHQLPVDNRASVELLHPGADPAIAMVTAPPNRASR
jgi:hypothetical protein